MQANEVLRIRIDPGASVPIYMQIIEKLHRLMVAGVLSPGDRLPTVRQLAGELEINFNTVARAYRWLEQAGLLSMCQGRGTFVLDRPLAALERQQMLEKENLEHFARRMLQDARRLGYSPADLAAAVIRAGETGTVLESEKKAG
ncbi:MAG: GntR family transcriptional regulator [Anaerolineaceae bacterium]|jgi:GntR family transcriptional regulator|nr:GntR family transcriptional regulator [Anaerolineaceae bacterium]